MLIKSNSDKKITIYLNYFENDIFRIGIVDILFITKIHQNKAYYSSEYKIKSSELYIV